MALLLQHYVIWPHMVVQQCVVVTQLNRIRLYAVWFMPLVVPSTSEVFCKIRLAKRAKRSYHSFVELVSG